MDNDKPGLGKAIIAGIIKDGLVRADSPGLCVWSASSDEVIEAIIGDWRENAEQCENCNNWTLEYGHDPEGIVICNECAEGLKDEPA